MDGTNRKREDTFLTLIGSGEEKREKGEERGEREGRMDGGEREEGYQIHS